MRFAIGRTALCGLMTTSALLGGCTTENVYNTIAAGGSAGTSSAHGGSNANGGQGGSNANGGSNSGGNATGGTVDGNGGNATGGSGGSVSSNGGTGTGGTGGPVTPVNLDTATIYSVFTETYAGDKKLNSITADLQRIHDLGFSTLYLLPVTLQFRKSINGHDPVNSPYSVTDYKAIDPLYGTDADLKKLVQTAHGLGMQVVLDEVLNHAAWDNALLTTHPEYFAHTDGNTKDPNSIKASDFPDAAQLDYGTAGNGLAGYMEDMLVYWVKTFDIDGFRFDTADNPYGSARRIPLDFWKELRGKLLAAKAGFFMLGESEDPELVGVVFDADYGWKVWGQYIPGLRQVAGGPPEQSAGCGSCPAMTTMKAALAVQAPGSMTGFLPATRHVTLLQDYDAKLDFTIFGGVPNTMAAATFNFTFTGIPMIWAGEEVGNDMSDYNNHIPINWKSSNASSFGAFYKSLISLRNGNSTLQKGDFAWLDNSVADHVVSFSRSDASAKFVIEINFSNSDVSGTLSSPPSGTFTDVSPSGSPGGTTHPAPPNFTLKAWDFAVFRGK